MNTLSSGYRIRLAILADAPQLAEIERAAALLFLATPYAFLAQSDPLPRAVVQQHIQAQQVWVAVDPQGIVVGFAIATEVDATFYLRELDVEPTHGQQGLGTALIETVCLAAQQQGYGAVTLSTFRHLAWNAPFYAKRGFQIWAAPDLTLGFRQIRQAEAEAGFLLSDRVIMRRMIGR